MKFRWILLVQLCAMVAVLANAAETRYLYDGGGNLLVETGPASATAGLSYLTQDALGSTRLVTDGAGAQKECLDYLPFGEEISRTLGNRPACYQDVVYPGVTAAGRPEQRFTGKERDQETGLDYFGARYLSSMQGRFTSPDRPLVDQGPSDPQSWNLYSYVRNNPLRRNDPSGLKCVDLDGGGQGDDGQPGKPCGKGAGLDLSHGVTVDSNGGSSGAQVYGSAFLRGDLQNGRIDSAPGDMLLALTAARGALSFSRGLGRTASQDVMIQGPFGAVSKAALEAAANSGGPTIRVVTRLTQAPQLGRALSTAVSDGAEALAAAALPGGQTFVANIPTQLISLLENAGLAARSTTSMGGATATEIRFYPAASEFIIRFFR